MSIFQAGDTDEIGQSAARLAESSGTPLNTGHLLLAILAGQGTASKTLRLRGLSETAVRNAIRSLGPEDDGEIRAVEEKAREFARSFQAAQVSALHLLAALSTVRSCHGHRVMAGAGLDTDTIRTQALRCLTTGFTREHGSAEPRPGPAASRGDALPLPEQLRGGKGDPPPVRRAAPEAAYDAPGGREAAPPMSSRAYIDAGSRLESLQRKTRSMRAAGESREAEVAERLDAEVRPGRAAGSDLETPVLSRPAGAPDEDRPGDGSSLSPDELPTLAALGRNLCQEAAEGRLDETIGRRRETDQMVDILNKRRANSPCLVGPPGVGKTAIVEGLAIRLARDEAPGLEGRVIVEVRPGDLLSGTTLRGALSERIGEIRKEVAASGGRVILFFDEVHALLGSSDAAEAVQELKAALGRGEMPCIFATTQEEYARHVEADPALTRRFTRIEVGEPTEEEAIAVLEGLRSVYEEHHDVRYDDAALAAAVRLSIRYVPDRALPDKAISALDLAGARARRAGKGEVIADDVIAVLAEQIGVPVERVSATGAEQLLDLEGSLSERIVGHAHVLEAIGDTLRRNAAGFRTGRPIGSFLFLGPTGVGKTETAKALADLLFPGSDSMVRLDMTEFAEPHAVARLVGAPPGYVGHEDGGHLTEAVRRRPYCLVLLDEIEKAHRDVIQVLLQVLDDARLTDGKGRCVAFDNTVIVMTSNLGSDLGTSARRRVGFGPAADEDEREGFASAVLGAARDALAPELWNRIDEPLVFEPLTRDEVSRIATLLLGGVEEQLRAEHGVDLEIGEGAIDALVEAGGYDARLGARPMRRTIQRLVEGPMARLILSGEIRPESALTLVGEGGSLSFETSSPAPEGSAP